MKFRKYNWFDIKKRAVKYGIQAHHNGQWENCCDGKEPLIFDKERDRDIKIEELGILAGQN